MQEAGDTILRQS